MSNTDSFVDEVTDAVRRDWLFAIFRRYAWVGVLVIVGIVGGAAWNEWQKAKAASRAEAFGNAIIDANDLGAPEDRMAALAAAPADREQAAIRQLLLAADPVTDRVGTLAALDALVADTAQPQIYRDLAVLRRVGVAGAEMPLADRRAALQSIAVAGRPFRPMAEEQLAYLLIEEGNTAEALVALTALVQDQDSPSGLRQRVAQMIVALGGDVPTALPVALPSAG